jgi:hypothetical protein
VPEEHLFPISAVTGRGVREAVTAVRGVLDQLGPAEVAPETDALNLTEVPRRFAPEVGGVWVVVVFLGGGSGLSARDYCVSQVCDVVWSASFWLKTP